MAELVYELMSIEENLLLFQHFKLPEGTDNKEHLNTARVTPTTSV